MWKYKIRSKIVSCCRDKLSDDFLSGRRTGKFQPNRITGPHINSKGQERTARLFKLDKARQLGHEAGFATKAKGETARDGLAFCCALREAIHQDFALFKLRLLQGTGDWNIFRLAPCAQLITTASISMGNSCTNLTIFKQVPVEQPLRH
jgi:hypothetical protein